MKWKMGEHRKRGGNARENQGKRGVGILYCLRREKGVTPIFIAGRYLARSLQAIFKD